ncbi:MAG: ATPase [Thermoprotei archaeon]|nr:MAG: ATPase [Thermoprotei archaeon]
MLEIVIASGKGGVGKSTLSSTLALILGKNGEKVVAVDADAEAPNLHLIFGVKEWEIVKDYREGWIAKIRYEKCDNCGICEKECPFKAIKLVDDKYVINEMICEGCLTCSIACPQRAIYRVRTSSGLLRAGKTPYGFPIVGAKLAVGRPNSGKLVTEVKNLAKEIGGNDSYYIVDAAAGIGCQVVSSLAGANGVILVVEPTPASLNDVARLHKLVKHFMLPSAIVINKADINPDFIPEILRFAERENIQYLGKIPYDDKVPESLILMKPLIQVFPESPASKALIDISNRIYQEIILNWREWFRRYKPAKPEPYKPLIIRPDNIPGG